MFFWTCYGFFQICRVGKLPDRLYCPVRGVDAWLQLRCFVLGMSPFLMLCFMHIAFLARCLRLGKYAQLKFLENQLAMFVNGYTMLHDY